jgi:hypothetical protein
MNEVIAVCLPAMLSKPLTSASLLAGIQARIQALSVSLSLLVRSAR